MFYNGVMGGQDSAKLNGNGVNGSAKQDPSSNGVSDLQFDTVDDTIEAFSMPCQPPSLLPSQLRKREQIKKSPLVDPTFYSRTR